MARKYKTIYEGEFGKHDWIPQYVDRHDYGKIKLSCYDFHNNPLDMDLKRQVITKISFFKDRGIKVVRVYYTEVK